MNKTIIININGIVFHIEEDAYEVLKAYMTDVKRHFSNSADSLEITTDIENRIAEMFSEILTKEAKQVIVEQDVKLVIEQMGTVADFESSDADETHEGSFAYNDRHSRKLFRDPEDHLVGGVCAGIASYFDVNVVWVRLLFAVFACIAGSGFFLYVILWLVVPKAVTRADKMAMKGEKQNLKGFKKNLEEELSSVRQNLSNIGDEAKPFVYKARDFAGDLFQHLATFFKTTGKVFFKLIGIVILLACFAAVIALVVTLIAVIILGQEPVNLFPFNIVKNELATRIYISAFIVASIPVLVIILATLKGFFNTGNIGRSTGSVFLVIWLCGLTFLIYYASKVSAQFRETASFTETVNVKPTKNNIYYLKLNDIKYFSHDDSTRLDIKNHFRNMILTDENANGNHDEPRSVTIKIERSDVNHPVLEERFRAKGGNYEDALFNARNTSYVFAQQDTILKFDYKLRKKPDMQWHAEEVELTLKVPLNSKVVIDQRLDNYLRDINVYDCKQANKDDKTSTAIFIMKENGLQCKVDTLQALSKGNITTSGQADSAQTIQQ